MYSEVLKLVDVSSAPYFSKQSYAKYQGPRLSDDDDKVQDVELDILVKAHMGSRVFRGELWQHDR